MARIRSIKPELPQSESMGNVSRDARLTFVQLFTLADDEGRLRGNSRMLASLLFPYDDGEDGRPRTTGKDVEAWMVELEREGCVVRYQIDGAAYVQIANWLIHQKIDKPSKSKIPPFVEPSRTLAKPLEVSSGEGIKDQGRDQGEEGTTTTDASAPLVGGGGGQAVDPDLDTPKAAPLPARGDLPSANNPALALTLTLRPLGVSALSTNPIVIGWADRGVSVELLTEAIRIAREHKGDATIPPQYLAPIVDRLLSPPLDRRTAPRGTGGQSQKFHFEGVDRSADVAAMQAGLAARGVTAADLDDDSPL